MICENNNENIGYSSVLTPLFKTDRTLLRIHPDGNIPGTRGCIGVQCKDARRFKEELDNFFNRYPNQSVNLPLDVNYNEN